MDKLFPASVPDIPVKLQSEYDKILGNTRTKICKKANRAQLQVELDNDDAVDPFVKGFVDHFPLEVHGFQRKSKIAKRFSI